MIRPGSGAACVSDASNPARSKGDAHTGGYRQSRCHRVGGASALVRMHLHLVLEIAMLFGEDMDHSARTREMGAVVVACAVSAATPPARLAVAVPGPLAVAAGGLSAMVASRVIGESAIRLYKRSAAAASAPAEG